MRFFNWSSLRSFFPNFKDTDHMTLQIPDIKKIPFGHHTQEFAHAKRWAINPVWLSQLKELNHDLRTSRWDVPQRTLILDAILKTIQLLSPADKDFAVMVDWDDYSVACMKAVSDNNGPLLMHFICTKDSFYLPDWNPEPEFINPSQPDSMLEVWHINPDWLLWACSKCPFPNEELSLEKARSRRLWVNNLLRNKLSRITGQHESSFGLIIDWERYSLVRETVPAEIATLTFMCGVHTLDLRRYEPVQATTKTMGGDNSDLLKVLGTPGIGGGTVISGPGDSNTAELLGDIRHLVVDTNLNSVSQRSVAEEANKNTSELNKFPENRGTMN